MKKRISILGMVTMLLVAVIGTALVTYVSVSKDLKYSYEQQLAEKIGESALGQKLSGVDKFITENFIKNYSASGAEDAVMQAYFDSLGDRYTYYLTKEEMDEFTSDSAGVLVGIGVHATQDAATGGIYITGVIKGAPAEKAGLLTGDIIIEIDGFMLNSDNYSEAVTRMKGEAGTTVNLSVKRGSNILSFTVERAEVESETVLYKKLQNTIALITITEFDGNTFKEFKATMEEAAADGCDRYIFDVRNNPGGNLTAIRSVLDYLLPKGTIINIVYKDGSTDKYDSDESCVTAPMVVLCNANTASAGELFTAALRDYDKAYIVGNTTFGKGTMQTVRTLPDGSGIRVSIAYYNPPCNISYDGTGITPDYEVSLSEEAQSHYYQMTYEEDVQLQKAVEIINK